MNRYGLLAVIIAAALLAAGCVKSKATEEKATALADTAADSAADGNTTSENELIRKLPQELASIPAEYFTESEYPGTLTELTYDTYESMTYDQQTQVLHKRAIVYLPYGYTEDNSYNVFYLMHGGWEDCADDCGLSYLQQHQWNGQFRLFSGAAADGQLSQ